LRLLAICLVWLALAGCGLVAQPTSGNGTATPAVQPALARITVDGASRELPTMATTVAQALAEAAVVLNTADQIDPPPDTLLRPGQTVAITVVRVTEATAVVPEAIPFQRQIVRSAEMSPDDPPRLLQAGRAGLQEVTVRIVYHDGLEAERWPTATTIVEPARDEIIMIGVAVVRDRMTFDGVLAYIDDGRAVLLEGDTDSPRQLAVTGTLDGRVFQLSPDGSYLLYTLGDDDQTATFRNTLWLLATTSGAVAQPLDIENVLWAGWDPSAAPPRIAYTTARSIALPPGWEANNDLWLLDIIEEAQPTPVRLIESYAAAYAWWGGQYAWSPDGRLAYAFADEVGVLTMPPPAFDPGLLGPAATEEPARAVLHTFTEFDTGADWAWVPSLSWSADGQYLAFGDHAGDDDAPAGRFDLRLADTTAESQIVLAEAAGIWSAAQWSPAAALPERQIAYLAAIEPEASQDSGYVLWLAGSDGRDPRRVFPPEGEASLFARSQPLAWGPDPDRMAFIFDNQLHILDLPTGEVFRAGQDDTVSSHPTWAPYGAVSDEAAP